VTRYIGLIALMGCGVSLATSSQDDSDTSSVTGVSLPMPGNGNPAGGMFSGCTNCDDVHPQGPYLVGELFDAPPFTRVGDPYYFHITDAYDPMNTHVTVRVNNIAALGAPSRPLNHVFNGWTVSNGTLTLQLSAQRGTDQIMHFTMKRKSGGAAYDTVVCDDAIPVEGRYSVNGTRIDDALYVTFACSDADIAKCTSWGYDPTTHPDAHQACTRMARDDIFSNGRSHTHLDTLIGMHDIYSVNGYPTDDELHVRPATLPPDPQAMFFEAAWGPNGPVCLGRFRWQSLKPDQLPDDPRTHNNALACDDDTVDSLIAKGAIIFEWSHFNDFGLFRWHTTMAERIDYVTTVRGYYSAIGGAAVPPFDDALYTFDAVDGYILRAIPTSITDPATELNLTTLYHENTTNRLVLALASNPQLDLTRFTAFPQPEGWVFTAPRPRTIPLTMYFNPASGDFLSTTQTNAVPAGYLALGILGYVFAVDTPDQ
jgi:hypothetical protein